MLHLFRWPGIPETQENALLQKIKHAGFDEVQIGEVGAMEASVAAGVDIEGGEGGIERREGASSVDLDPH